MKNSIATKITIFTGAAIILCSALASSIYYIQYTKELDRNIFERLSYGINIIRNIADLSNINTLNSPESKNTDYYRHTLEQFHSVSHALGFSSLYAMTYSDGKLTFVFDTINEPDGSEEKSDFLKEYQSPPEEIEQAVKTGELTYTKKPFTDEFGTFQSVFLKLKAGSNDIVIGADYDIKDIKRFKSRAALLFAAIMAGVIVIAMLMVYYVKRIAVKPILEIITSLNDITENADLGIR